MHKIQPFALILLQIALSPLIFAEESHLWWKDREVELLEFLKVEYQDLIEYAQSPDHRDFSPWPELPISAIVDGKDNLIVLFPDGRAEWWAYHNDYDDITKKKLIGWRVWFNFSRKKRTIVEPEPLPDVNPDEPPPPEQSPVEYWTVGGGGKWIDITQTTLNEFKLKQLGKSEE